MQQYHKYSNEVNRQNTSLRKSFYERKVKNLKESDPRKWWVNMKSLLGINNSSNNQIQNLANSTCNGNLEELAEKTNTCFQSVSQDMEPLPPNSEFYWHRNEHVPDQFTDCTIQILFFPFGLDIRIYS